MNISQALYWCVLIVGLLNFLHLGFYITGGNIYDILKVIRRFRDKKSIGNTSPKVTILIPAHNEEKSIIRCLETVSQSTYTNFSIVVIDDCSTDKTAGLVEEYINHHGRKAFQRLTKKNGRTIREYFRPTTYKPAIVLLKLPANGGKANALNYALRHAVNSGLVMTLDADSALDKHALSHAVTYFSDVRVVGVAANVRIMDQYTLLGMLQKFEHMIGYRSKKFYSLTNSEFIIGGVASTYRYEILKKVGFYDTDTTTEDIGLSMKIVYNGNREQRIVYAEDVIASTEGVQTLKALLKQRYRWKMGSLQNLYKYRKLLAHRGRLHSRMLTLYRIPMAFFSELLLVVQPFVLAYVLYISIIHHTFGLFVGGYFTITLYILWTVWPDENHARNHKLLLSLYTPGMYFCFLIMDVIQITSIFWCLFNFKQIIDRGKRQITWKSPERLGRAVKLPQDAAITT